MFEAYFVEKNVDQTWVYVSGWGICGDVYEDIHLGGNRLVVTAYTPDSFVQDLFEFLNQKNLEKVCFFANSLGAFLVTDFVLSYPELVERCIFLGLRPRYNREELFQIDEMIHRSLRAFLRSFYRQCFVNLDAFNLFMSKLKDGRLSFVDLSAAQSGLAYLKEARWCPKRWPTEVSLQVVHGTLDDVSPYQEMSEIMFEDNRFLTLEGQGHLCLDDVEALYKLLDGF